LKDFFQFVTENEVKRERSKKAIFSSNNRLVKLDNDMLNVREKSNRLKDVKEKMQNQLTKYCKYEVYIIYSNNIFKITIRVDIILDLI